MQIRLEMGLHWAMVDLFYFGYFTAGLVLILPVFNTFKKVLSMKSVGGGTRVEPFVASLLGYACSLILALFQDKWEFHKLKADESFWINGLAAAIYLVYLALFLSYADYTVRLTTLRAWAPAAAAYLGVTTIAGLLDESMVGVKWLCMIAGVASSGTPLFLVTFVMERSLENLPDWFSSSVGLLHYLVWIFRAYPELDLYDSIQNASGMLCSLAFLVPLFMWRNQNQAAAEQRGDEYEHLLGNQNDQVNIQVDDQGGDNQAKDVDNGQLGAINLQQLPGARRAASAPATPEKAAIHKRSSSA